MQLQKRAHPGFGQIGARQQAGRICQTEHVCIVNDIAAGLQGRWHDEMRLIAIQPRKKGNPCLVIPRRGAKDLPAQGNSRGQQGVIGCGLAKGQRLQRLTGRGRYGRENAQQGMRKMRSIAGNQISIVEVIAGIQPDPIGQSGRNACSCC
jgi:hypothetical protein